VHRRGIDRRESLPAGVRYVLLHGRRDPAAVDVEDAEAFLVLGALLRGHVADLWVEHRIELLDHWTARYPGTRPAAWWSVEAEEPRRVIEDPDGRVVPGFNGFPWVWRRRQGIPFHGNSEPPGAQPIICESEATYLRRLGLLTGAERKRLDRDAYAPEEVIGDGAHSQERSHSMTPPTQSRNGGTR
jgi:hypothetical protein